jgi:hypothetical protein
VLQDLNKESLLLLCAADELSARDRAQVARMLASDAEMRLQLAAIEEAMQGFGSRMARLDAMAMPSDSLALRRIGQAMRQHMAAQLAQAARKPAQAAHSRMRYPWWAYPAVAAAVVLIAFISWWGARPDQPMRYPAERGSEIANSTQPASQSDSATQLAAAEEIQKSFSESNLTQPQKSVASLDAAEDQIAELSRTQADFRYSGGDQ